MRVKSCGVCHSDIHLWRGGFDLGGGKWLSLADQGRELPMVMGHEAVGEVVAIGPDADGISIGDTRLVFPWIGCGSCDRCADNDEANCLKMRSIGIDAPGGYADHVIAPHPRYLLDISGIAEDCAGTLACAGVTAYGALKKTLPLAADDHVVIIGAGGVGLTAVSVAAGYLDNDIIVVDIDDKKLDAALDRGATHVVNSSTSSAGNPAKEIRKISGGGAGAVIDFVGSSETASLGVGCLRKGGKHITVGLFGGEATLSLALMVFLNHTFQGSYLGSLDEVTELITLVQDGKIQLAKVETRPLDQITHILEELEAGQIVGRVVVTP